ncbi:MAG: helix-turn-helix transcriptional regulator [Defluviitaleaceae bacterium]|nr:helix-turn-helix transcriptional regulator [Defluviitaleaceae bacterium]
MEKNNVKARNDLLERFCDLGGNLNSSGEEALEKDINHYFKSIGESDAQLLDILRLLKIFKLGRELNYFDFTYKIIEIYRIAKPIIQRLKYINVDNWDVHDLRIAQFAIGYAETIEEADELCQKVLIALKKRMKGEPTYKRAKFHYHMNMLSRALKAEFFEIDPIQEEERFKQAQDIFEHHLNEALKISNKDKDLLLHELAINIRAATMDRNSKEVMKNLDAIKEIEGADKVYDIMREELAEYSFHPGFDLTEKHFAIALGVRMKKLRLRLGITREQLAERLGYSSASNISSIERGETNLPGFKIAKVADIFGVKIDELCYGTDGRRKTPLSKEDFKYPPLEEDD